MSDLTGPHWKHVENPKLGYFNTISKCLAQKELLEPSTFPDFSGLSKLLITTDFSGQDANSTHYVIAAYLTSFDTMMPLAKQLQAWRATMLGDSRRLNFKSLSDGKRWNAMPAFHNIVQEVLGMLFVVAVDKRDTELIKHAPAGQANRLELLLTQTFKPNVLNRV